ncbi:LysR substrate-binding domain-containing protein [Novosphingobium olei]|uniref:LysR substrate-binding domain-containing protein n=1 Tax=Novosphingobium olei TaxID=2728851 RepID=UPI0030901AF5|nr:LysR substrate-binding domain-containing protein [Novosphingobium olei]
MIRRLPPLRSLEAFIRVVRAGSAKTAAAELALSPSALSRRLAALEEFVGKPLFERKHQMLKLTEEGQGLYDAVAPLMDEMTDRIDRLVDTGKVMRLRLGVLPLFGSQRLFPRLGELRKLHPQLHIDIDSSNVAETKLGDTIDAAIILSEGPDATLHSVRLDHNRVHAIASKQLVEELGERPDVSKLSKQTFLIHNDLPMSFEAWKRALHIEHLEPAAIDHFDSGQLILEAAAQGLGIAIMHDDHYLRSHDPRLARVYDIDVDSPYSYWFVCRPRALQSRPVRLFHDWMLKAGL